MGTPCEYIFSSSSSSSTSNFLLCQLLFHHRHFTAQTPKLLRQHHNISQSKANNLSLSQILLSTYRRTTCKLFPVSDRTHFRSISPNTRLSLPFNHLLVFGLSQLYRQRSYKAFAKVSRPSTSSTNILNSKTVSIKVYLSPPITIPYHNVVHNHVHEIEHCCHLPASVCKTESC